MLQSAGGGHQATSDDVSEGGALSSSIAVLYPGPCPLRVQDASMSGSPHQHTDVTDRRRRPKIGLKRKLFRTNASLGVPDRSSTVVSLCIGRNSRGRSTIPKSEDRRQRPRGVVADPLTVTFPASQSAQSSIEDGFPIKCVSLALNWDHHRKCDIVTSPSLLRMPCHVERPRRPTTWMCGAISPDTGAPASRLVHWTCTSSRGLVPSRSISGAPHLA